jgi:hypothetical protein
VQAIEWIMAGNVRFAAEARRPRRPKTSPPWHLPPRAPCPAPTSEPLVVPGGAIRASLANRAWPVLQERAVRWPWRCTCSGSSDHQSVVEGAGPPTSKGPGLRFEPGRHRGHAVADPREVIGFDTRASRPS